MKRSYVIAGFALMVISVLAILFFYTNAKTITDVLSPNETFNFKVDQPSVVLFHDPAQVNFSFHNLTVIKESDNLIVQGFNGSITAVNNTTHPVTLKYTVIVEGVSFGADFVLLVLLFVVGAALVLIGVKK